MRVPFATLERGTWRKARQLPYGAQLGGEEGFRARGIECLTLTAPWQNLQRVRRFHTAEHRTDPRVGRNGRGAGVRLTRVERSRD